MPTLRGIGSTACRAGANFRAIEVGDRFWAIVQSVPEWRARRNPPLARGLQNLDWAGPRAVAHEHVIESFLSSTALLPMQLFTLLQLRRDRVVEHVWSDRARITRILKRIEKKVEWACGSRGTSRRRVTRPRRSRRGPAPSSWRASAMCSTSAASSSPRPARPRIVYKAIDRQAAASQAPHEPRARGARLEAPARRGVSRPGRQERRVQDRGSGTDARAARHRHRNVGDGPVAGLQLYIQ